MIDPRPAVVSRRLEDVGRIFAVTGGKGGIGKSMVACLLASGLARAGRSVGLLDLDLTGPCVHLILGFDERFPSEEHGVEPHRRDGIDFMSISCFGGARPVPLRGPGLTQALLELLAITRWGELDELVIDLPPGLGDVALDAIRLLPRSEYLVVATPSRVVIDTVRRTLELLAGVKARIGGVIENMKRDDSPAVRELAAAHGAPYLGALPWDADLEPAIGDTRRLSRTDAAHAMDGIALRLLG